MVHDPVDRRRGGHGVLENPIPLREHEVGGDHDALALVALGEQGEQHFHLRAVVLNIADVVQYQALDAIELPEFAREAQIALGLEQSFHQRGHRHEQHRVALAHEFVAEGGHDMGLAGAGENNRILPETKVV